MSKKNDNPVNLACLTRPDGSFFPVSLGGLYSPEDFLRVVMDDDTANCFMIQVVEVGDKKSIRCVGKLI